MIKTSLSIVLAFILCLVLGVTAKEYIDYEIYVRFIIFFCIFFGLFVLYRDNIKKNKYLNIKRKSNFKRIFYKFFTFFLIWMFCLLFSLFVICVIDFEYYINFYNDALFYSPVIFLLIFFWIVYYDKRMNNPYDDYYYFSVNFLKGKVDFVKHKKFILASIVKILFIPYMYSATVDCIYQILRMNYIDLSSFNFIKFMFLFGLCLDLIIAFGGYLISSKYFGTDNISIDTSWLGWLGCMVCYAPLVVITELFTHQVDAYIWSYWLSSDQIMYWVWGGVLTFTWLVYWFSTLSFGFRFSNLSWRGLVDKGAYRYLKHPAYLSKNIYWWLHTVPWFGVVGLDILRNILALVLVSSIYYLRAKTEERHLLQFEEYQKYSIWMRNNGLWSQIQKKNKILFKRINFF